MSYHGKGDESPNTRRVEQSTEDALLREARRQRRTIEDARRNTNIPSAHQPMVMPSEEE